MVAVRDEVRFDLSIALNGVGILNDFLVAADVVETQNLIEAVHDFAHLEQFVLVVGGEYDLFHKLQSIGSIPFCIR